MTDTRESHEVLSSILQVLQQIERKLDAYEERIFRLEGGKEKEPRPYNSVEYIQTKCTILEGSNEDRISAARGQDEKLPEDGNSKPRIYYSEWDTNHFIESMPQDKYNEWDTGSTNLDEIFDFRLSDALQRRLGDCWNMPDDDRLPLKFFKANILRSQVPWGTPLRKLFSAKQPFERELDRLCRFDQELRAHKGNDFVVVDFDALNSSRIYRLGEPAIGPDLLVNLEDTQEAPWSRVMYGSSVLPSCMCV